MYGDNNGIGLEEVNRLVTDAMTDIEALKEAVTDYWGGPAAISYQNILAQSINLSRLSILLNELEGEIAEAMRFLEPK